MLLENDILHKYNYDSKYSTFLMIPANQRIQEYNEQMYVKHPLRLLEPYDAQIVVDEVLMNLGLNLGRFIVRDSVFEDWTDLPFASLRYLEPHGESVMAWPLSRITNRINSGTNGKAIHEQLSFLAANSLICVVDDEVLESPDPSAD